MALLRKQSQVEKIEPQMAPMIDVVFQLLIFFMLTLKIIPPEGDFNINMPLGAPSQANEDPLTTDLKVRLYANRAGGLQEVEFNKKSLGRDPQVAFQRLNEEVKSIVARPGSDAAKEIQVEIQTDYDLENQYAIKALSACMGYYDPKTKEVVRLIEKVNFAEPISR